ncbi:L-threonylcarbamoyladenylate synthase [Nematocida minor]|uniref:L-threonylcarbamoyladenylate synthase n=1 Tax=Nematocida minor TaxID=1912983 RepID=UPI00221F396E|nr:L-threonylcarbamoyladenylate synthase [Nematocida minor]KAI5189911.1 L-threonylcarbamoyladenylate synthase [Nematocida minor]
MPTEIVKVEGNLKKIKEAFDRAPVPFPTETVYGLGASVWREDLIKRVFEIKGRPSDNPLIVHISSLNMLKECIEGEIPEIYTELMHLYWPGPLTLLFKKSKKISRTVTGNGEYVAIRMPNHKDALLVIDHLEYPIVGPSANKSTRPSPTRAEHVLEDLNNEVPLIIDGGVCAQGVESTVINGLHSPPLLLRPGVISFEEIKEHLPTIKMLSEEDKDQGKASPGTRYKHYSPTAVVTMVQGTKSDVLQKLNGIAGENVGFMLPDEFIEGLAGAEKKNIYSLGNTAKTAAQRLFDGLRYLDRHVQEIYTVELEASHEGRAVMDRLSRATSRWM